VARKLVSPQIIISNVFTRDLLDKIQEEDMILFYEGVVLSSEEAFFGETA
jgi:hypothetical protein